MTNLSTMGSRDVASSGNLSHEQPIDAPTWAQGTSAQSASLQGEMRTDPLRAEAAQQATRRAARLNASKVSDQEIADLLAERQKLLDKHFAGTLTKSERTRLEYVRWSLDRIDDAKHGAALDVLESHVTRFEELSDQLDTLREQLARAALNSRRGRPRR